MPKQPLPDPDSTPGGSVERLPSWRRQIEAIGHTLRIAERHGPEAPPARGAEPPRRLELWLLVDLDATQTSGELTLDLFQRQERKSGGMGSLKPLVLDHEKARDLTEPGDRALAPLLRALPAGDSPWNIRTTDGGDGLARHRPGIKMVRVPAALYDTVLPRLAASGRLGWWEGTRERPDPDRRLAWDDGPPWRLTLRLEAGSGDGATLTGSLAREGAVVDLREPVLLLAHGLVLFEDRIARLETASSFAWISCFRHQSTIRIPQDEVAAAVEALGEMPSLPPLVLGEELPVTRESLPVEPVLALDAEAGSGRVDPGERGLRGTLAFRYGDHRVTAGDPRSVLIEGPSLQGNGDGSQGVRVLRRDREAEAEARRRLLDLGALPERGGDDFFVPGDRFLSLVDTLLQERWRVEARRAPLRRAGRFHLSVGSGVDWFDLSGSLDFGGEAVALPRVLEAVRRGRDYVELGDGSHGMLPRDWLERFGALADLGTATEPNASSAEAVRFQRSQALLVDSLLDTAPSTLQGDVQVDEAFARLRERLASGHEVAPRDEPDGFRGELRHYQKHGLGWLSFLTEVGLGGCLADDMGLGKTVQVLALLLAEKEAGKRDRDGGRPARRPSLVVAPRSLVYNWLDEAERFAPGLATLDYTGSGRDALRERFGEHDLVVTTYGTLRRDAAALAEIRFDHVILDEAQAIKNADSQTAKAARLLQARHRLALTGTPVENHLAELGSLFEFLNPGMLGRSNRLQDVVTSRRASALEDEPGVSDLARTLAPFILRRTKAQVLPELPPKTEQTLVVTLGRRQRALYDELRDHYRARLAKQVDRVGLERSKMQVLEALLRLRQAACHPGLLDDTRADEGSAKLEALREQLDEVLDEGHKALVFSQFTSLLALVRRDLDADGVPYEYLDGQTRDRAARVERFQTDPECRLFLISLKAGGLGLNLTAADYVFLLDPWWNPAVEAQAVDRAHRIGQERPVIAYRLIARDTVEEKILKLQETKRDLAEAVLAESGGGLKKLSAEDLQLLLS